MANIITAIIEEDILKKINKNKIAENKNLLYKEAIIDTLKKNNNIDTIIISEKIPGEIEFIKLVKKIKKINKKIKIIIILSNKKIEQELIKNNIKEIYYNNIFSINKLIKKIKETNNLNFKNEKNIKKNIQINNNKINKTIKIIIEKICEIINKNKIIENKIICIFGKNEIDKKIIELYIIKKIILENNKVIIMNLKIKNNKKRNSQKKKIKKIMKIKNIKKKYYLQNKINYKLKEKILDRNIKKILNINKILKDKNKLIKIKIVKEIINKYKESNYYIILNSNYVNDKILMNEIKFHNSNLNILVADNKKETLLRLNKNINRKINLIIFKDKKNNISKYFYRMILKNKFNKIKIININY